MKRYSAYKETENPSSGLIPEHWQSTRLHNICNFIRGNSAFQKDDLSTEGHYVALQYGKTYKVEKVDERFQFYVDKKFYKSSQRVNFDDVVFVSTSETVEDLGHSVHYLRKDIGLIGSEQILLKPHTKTLDGNYLFYATKYFGKKLGGLSKGLKVFRFNIDDLKTISLSFPEMEEQKSIANYLDKETEKIDQKIAGLEKKTLLYKELKQSIINETVTRGLPAKEAQAVGLNPNPPLKDSGIPWIGEIPEHWEVKRLVNICDFIRGNSTFGKNDLLDEGDYIALQYGKTYKVDQVDEKFQFYVNENFYKSLQRVKQDDVVFVSTSETMDDLGHSYFYARKDIGLLGGEQILLRSNSKVLNGKYLYYISKSIGRQLRRSATGTKVFRFNITDIKTIFIHVPAYKEQAAIASYLDCKTTHIDKITATITEQITTLNQLRKTLINDVVTGKICVTDDKLTK